MNGTMPATRAEAIEARNRDLTIPQDAGRYLRAHKILTELRARYLNREITPQQYRTIRGQALHGDIDGAVKWLARVIDVNRARAGED